MFAVDLESVERLVTARVTRRFERRQRAVAEARQERAGVVDLDLFDLAGEVVLAFLDEGLGHGGDRLIGPLSHIAVSMQCASRSPVTPLPATLGIEPPQSGAALRQILRDRPVLQKFGAVVEDPAEAALVDDLFSKRDRRNAAVIVPDHVRTPWRFRRPPPCVSLSAALRPSGFSHMTILPAFAAAMAISA